MIKKLFTKIKNFFHKIFGCGKKEEDKNNEEVVVPPIVEDVEEEAKDDILGTPSDVIPPIEEADTVDTELFVIIDNGHGQETPGKCSPDKSLFEWSWNREVAKMLSEKLSLMGIKNQLLVTTDKDISLSKRCKEANALCNAYGKSKCIVISVHINAAASDGKWHNANGWSVWVAPNASGNSKKLAQFLYNEADKMGLKGNRSVPIEKYWVGNFAIIRDTVCPAVLTENMFQDNKEDVKFLLSQEGKEKLVDVHVNGILDYIKWRGI